MPRCKRARLPHYDNHSCSLKFWGFITVLYLVAIAWTYVVLMMSVAEALAPTGSLLGAAITFVIYGALPLALVLYLLGTPARRRALREAQASAAQPDGGGHAAGGAVAAKREEP
jgi:membrane protein implicated in regulation of membrane protease activity